MLLRLELYTLKRNIIVAVSRGEHPLLPASPGAIWGCNTGIGRRNDRCATASSLMSRYNPDLLLKTWYQSRRIVYHAFRQCAPLWPLAGSNMSIYGCLPGRAIRAEQSLCKLIIVHASITKSFVASRIFERKLFEIIPVATQSCLIDPMYYIPVHLRDSYWFCMSRADDFLPYHTYRV